MDGLQLHSGAAEEVRRRYSAVDVANVADVLDQLAVPHQALAPEFVPFPARAGKLAGWAFTIAGEAAAYSIQDGDQAKMEACGHLMPGSVAVWSGGGNGECCFGELIAIGMKERGCVGALVDGGVRDVAWIGKCKFPVYARYRTPIQAIGRWRVTTTGIPVRLPGATQRSVEVVPGDFILADADGAIVIPQDLALQVLDAATELGKREVDIRAAISRGLSLAAALEKFGHV